MQYQSSHEKFSCYKRSQDVPHRRSVSHLYIFEVFNLIRNLKKARKAHSEPSQAYQMTLFAKIVYGFELLTVLAKSSILHV